MPFEIVRNDIIFFIFQMENPYGNGCDNPYDNAMAENFFSILKTECIYRQNQRHSRKRMI